MRRALVTGSAGFIGMHVAERLLNDGYEVTGLDCFSDYYDPALKRSRTAQLTRHARFTAEEGRIEDPNRLMDLFAERRFDVVVHLAAQAGVRYSIDNPRSYVESNLIGTFELLEAARAHPPAHMLLASTSSAYGANTQMPYTETMKADTQMSFYAATKKANESMAHSYAHLFGLPVTMFRFFTVYGPWSRPDMAPYKFVSAILEDREIDIYNHGDMMRDFTYIDDLVEGIRCMIDTPPRIGAPVSDDDSLSPVAPFRVVNIGNAAPVRLLDFVAAIESALGRPAKRRYLDMQPGDVPATWADTTLLSALTGYAPKTQVAQGVANFVAWYRDYYGH
ncbi:NAD-dependent epimerase/dehydratase family protein [Mesobaculum littorinae]|uniref:NAD-dependent epimerase/dehydratase family protein n=1 Tax=Mesobaculum littorinae TaxID=2486419 RepID=A0A438ADN6_9RHOB|nr:NAD-dependent epimerase/dehydratase family protein [Mesobaculum littorinae]RVV96823.1 NAD-dependent epimerase/dehydratase family protein [Mesobaculum littorinae]